MFSISIAGGIRQLKIKPPTEFSASDKLKTFKFTSSLVREHWKRKSTTSLKSKQALAEQVVGSGESWLTELDTDRLRNLLLLDRSAIVEEDEA